MAIIGVSRQPRCVARAPERCERARVIGNEIEVELQMPSGIQARGVNDSQTASVEQERPDGAAAAGVRHGEPPVGIDRCAPGSDQDRNGAIAAAKRRGSEIVGDIDVRRSIESEQREQRCACHLEQRARRRRRPERRTAGPPRDQLATNAFVVRRRGLGGDVLRDEHARQQVTVDAR
jgi:hypothetical protein